ncbi:Tetratricopeptide repeat protein [Rubripirellula lacrimiformis]|uniref:Tetratricopeptide repeat protein n=1 Tax=Rubripirellula lacrimiformis TaxID=1930273 RepID=A0A517N743_9BACT|nr:hypothetical protein [Rubripirellula lacrimiformis]QDT02967.1 Tetratricopeptide repeat protein [Rubripirellula lacrimiformis]
MTCPNRVIALMICIVSSSVCLAQDVIEPTGIEQLLAQSDHDLALQACLIGIQQHPDETEYWRLQAQALRGLGRIGDIPAAVSPAIELHPRDSGLILQRAIAYKNLGKIDEMTSDAQSMVRLGDGLGYVLLAQLAQSNGDRLTEIRCYTRLMETYPDSPDLAEWQFSRAQQLAAIHLLDWAFADVTASNQASPAPLKVLLLGELHARAEHWEKAEAMLAEFNTMTDKHYVGEVRRLSVLMDMNEVDKVTMLLQQYQQKYAGSDQAAHVADVQEWLDERNALKEQLRTAGKANHRPDGFETAEEMTAGEKRMQELARATDPAERQELKERLIHHAQLGMVLSNAEYADVMLKTLGNLQAKFVMTSQDRAREATVKAWLQMQSDDYVAAAATAKDAIRLDANSADAYRVAASIDFMTDDMQDALAAAEMSVQLDPLNSLNYGYLGLIQTDLGNPAAALKALNQAHHLDPSNEWIAALMVRFADSVGLHEAAILYHGSLRKGIYVESMLERCEMLLSAGLPQLATPDAIEYAEATEDHDEAEVASVVARGMHAWYEQTIAFGTGGPNMSNVLKALERAVGTNPDNARLLMLQSDALRRDGQYAESLAIAEQLLSRGADFAVLFQHIANLQLALGDLAGAVATNEAIQQITYEDDESVSIQKEIATVVALASELVQTLTEVEFTSDTGTAMGNLLASPDDTPQAFKADYAVKLSEFYEGIRPETKGVTLKPEQTDLRIEVTTTQELREQDPVIFNFDHQLAQVANELQDGLYWFTVRCKNPETDSGPSFGYFVKTENGWRLFPEPWAIRE